MELSKQIIISYLKQTYKQYKIYIFETIDSTNNYAKQIVQKGIINDRALIIANSQTAGRGRFDRKFFSPAKTGIYMTFILFPKKNINDILSATIISAIAVVKSIKNLTNIQTDIKWVNDIFLNNKKIAGILAETVINAKTNIVESLVIGIGININTNNFPTELKNIATSLDVNLSRNQLIAEITNNFFDLYDMKQNINLIAEYKKYLILNRDVTYYINNKQYKGKMIDINNSGNLIIKTNNKQITLQSGEIFLNE